MGITTTWTVVRTSQDITHHGIKGQKWGVRRFQNPDGSLTEAGKRRYTNPDGSYNFEGRRLIRNSFRSDYFNKAKSLGLTQVDSENVLDAIEWLKLPIDKQERDEWIGMATEILKKYNGVSLDDLDISGSKKEYIDLWIEEADIASKKWDLHFDPKTDPYWLQKVRLK